MKIFVYSYFTVHTKSSRWQVFFKKILAPKPFSNTVHETISWMLSEFGQNAVSYLHAHKYSEVITKRDRSSNNEKSVRYDISVKSSYFKFNFKFNLKNWMNTDKIITHNVLHQKCHLLIKLLRLWSNLKIKLISFKEKLYFDWSNNNNWTYFLYSRAG